MSGLGVVGDVPISFLRPPFITVESPLRDTKRTPKTKQSGGGKAKAGERKNVSIEAIDFMNAECIDMFARRVS